MSAPAARDRPGTALAAGAAFRFAHVSDWHLPPPAGVAPWRAGNLKQWLGGVSWALNRRRHFRAEVGEAALRAVAAAAPDHVCVTGDLVNFGLPGEFAEAARWLERLEQVAPLSLVPGNHDALVRAAVPEFRGRWHSWLQAGPAGAAYPAVWRQGPVAVVGLSSAVPTRPFMAHGVVDRGQLAALDELLPRLRAEGRFRIVLVHHPVQRGAAAPRRALRNAPALRALLRRRGAELVLHGHMHVPLAAMIEGPDGPIPVFGAGAAAQLGDGKRRGHFHLFTLRGEAGAWRLEVTHHGHDPATGEFRGGAAARVAVPPGR